MSAPESAHKALLSKRAREAAASPDAVARQKLIETIFNDQYNPDTNPDGMIIAGVAENSLMAKEMAAYYEKNFKIVYSDFTYGTGLNCSRRLGEALCKFFNKYFQPIVPVKREHIVVGNGASALIDQLVEKICDPGDGILLSAPYYNGFDGDIKARSLGVPIPVQVPIEDQATPKALEAFEAKMQEMKERSEQPARAIILCNPHNPLGFIYPKETILEFCRFAEKHDLHLIVDEIYALSVYKTPNTQADHPPFQSVLSMDVRKEAGCDPSRVHVIYGMSKDFDANGFRVGVFVSQHNKKIVSALTSTALFMLVSSPADSLWSTLLNDEDYLPKYIADNQSRLGEAYAHVAEFLQSYRIPFYPSSAGLFVTIDLRDYLPMVDKHDKPITDAKQRETALFDKFIDGKMYIAPGASYHYPTPGFFRLTFAIRRDYLDICLQRLAGVLGKRPELN